MAQTKSKSKNKSAPKSRCIMYEQQIRHLPNGMTQNEIYELCVSKLKPSKIAMIIHDKDLKEDGVALAEPHIHIALEFQNGRYISSISELIGDKPQQFTIWHGKSENCFSYLIHATDNARDKYQYSSSAVIANFDYVSFIDDVSKKVKSVQKVTKTKKMDIILDMIANGEKSVKEVKEVLSGSEYAKNAEKIKKAHELYLERKAIELHRSMEENGEIVEIHWFYGISESGKSYLAEKLASEMGDYYKTTTSTDPFQFYQAEETVIFDEFRPGLLPYSELLALFNPFSRGNVKISSRYFNKALAVKTIFITSPLDPISFYKAYNLKETDSGQQLYRRLSSVIKFDMDFIYSMQYEPSLDRYVEIGRKTNNFSRKKQKRYELKNIFNII